MRRLEPPVTQTGGTGFDGSQRELAGVRIRGKAAMSGHLWICALLSGENAVRIRLPGFQKRVAQRKPRAVKDRACNLYYLALRAIGDRRSADLFVIGAGIAGIGGHQADMDVRTGRLGRCFLQRVEFLDHFTCPPACSRTWSGGVRAERCQICRRGNRGDATRSYPEARRACRVGCGP